MFQGWPKPGSVKVQTETFLKKDSLSACQIKHQIRIDLINVLGVRPFALFKYTVPTRISRIKLLRPV